MALQAFYTLSIFMSESWGLAPFMCLIIITFYYLAYKQILLEMTKIILFFRKIGLSMSVYATLEQNTFTLSNSNCMLHQALKRLTHYPTLAV